MPGVSLNTASYVDITALDGIDQHRASANLKLWEEKGFITEDDIQQFLQGTYSTIKALMNEGKVSPDTPPHSL